MFEVTWIDAGGVRGISAPKFRVALRVFLAMRRDGVRCVRLWDRRTRRPALAF